MEGEGKGEGEGEGKGRVCVTGATGYLASWLIMRLLQHGYFVNATIRSHSGHEKDVSYLTDLKGASERLKLYTADLDKPDTFEEPIKGCIGVFHVAHPIDFAGKEPQEALNQRAIKGTIGILQLCLDSKTVRRVVYTSSASTVVLCGTDLKVKDEESWSDVDFIKENLDNLGAPYYISKILTEKAAMEFAEKNGLDLVTVNPTYIHGPFIGPSCPGSVRMSLAMIFGDVDNRTYALLSNFQLAHVDDVASAHIFLFEHPNAKGRYICSAHDMSIDELAKFLSARYSEFQIPKIDFPDDIMGRRYFIPTSKKLLETGFKYKYSVEETFDEAIQCCKEKGIL